MEGRPMAAFLASLAGPRIGANAVASAAASLRSAGDWDRHGDPVSITDLAKQ